MKRSKSKILIDLIWKSQKSNSFWTLEIFNYDMALGDNYAYVAVV